jgi:S-adenosylmethionine:tRNA ribosyltransferase-isomerase
LEREIVVEGKTLTLSVERGEEDLVHFSWNDSTVTWAQVLDACGELPIPPYLNRATEASDLKTYQTVYSKVKGSVAAPTAGLHFTRELLDQIREKGVKIAQLTLHVGLGTFRPVKVDDVAQHHMHTEHCMIDEQTAALINETKRAGGRVVAVGTTSCRTLESMALEDGSVRSGEMDTSIFIYPGYRFKVMDALITNFHLPESTLVMLVSAFAGKEQIMNAYAEAVKERYRFFSFGDAMLIC